MKLCRASHSPLYALVAAAAVGSMLTACGDNGSDTDSTTTTLDTETTVTETTVMGTTEAPEPTTSPTVVLPNPTTEGDLTVQIPSPDIPSPPAMPGS